jgi:fibronectin type III domain protein
MILKVSLGFARLPDTELDNFAQAVITAITGNAAYPSPPVDLPDVLAAKNQFTAKLAAADSGGPMDTAVKNTARQKLIGMLRQLAVYVQMSCNNDLSTLLSSGFQAQSTNRASAPLDQPQGLVIKNGASGQLVASVMPVKNTSMYEGRIKPSDGDWLASIFSGDSQHVTFSGLTPGKNYTAQVRALGGSTGQSDWSDPSSHMAM